MGDFGFAGGVITTISNEGFEPAGLKSVGGLADNSDGSNSASSGSSSSSRQKGRTTSYAAPELLDGSMPAATRFGWVV